MVLTVPDLESLQSSALSDFDKWTAVAPAGRAGDFARDIARLEGQLEAIYRLGVLLQRRETSMDTAFAVWDSMVRICDTFLKRLETLMRDHPHCEASHDKMLDLRLAAVKRRELHRRPQP